MHINRFHLCCPHIVWPQKWHFVKVNLFVISVIYSTVSIKRDETTHNTLWSETSQDFNRPICKGPSEASRVCLYSIHYSIILTEHNVAYKEMWEGKKNPLPSLRINISTAGAEQEPTSTHCVELTFPTPHRSYLPHARRSPGQPLKRPLGGDFKC